MLTARNADSELRKAWREWERSDPKAFRKFKNWEAYQRRKYEQYKEHEITGLMPDNETVDEFEANQILVDLDNPIPIDRFFSRRGIH